MNKQDTKLSNFDKLFIVVLSLFILAIIGFAINCFVQDMAHSKNQKVSVATEESTPVVQESDVPVASDEENELFLEALSSLATTALEEAGYSELSTGTFNGDIASINSETSTVTYDMSFTVIATLPAELQEQDVYDWGRAIEFEVSFDGSDVLAEMLYNHTLNSNKFDISNAVSHLEDHTIVMEGVKLI